LREAAGQDLGCGSKPLSVVLAAQIRRPIIPPAQHGGWSKGGGGSHQSGCCRTRICDPAAYPYAVRSSPQDYAGQARRLPRICIPFQPPFVGAPSAGSYH
jgi:hypothetical protein